MPVAPPPQSPKKPKPATPTPAPANEPPSPEVSLLTTPPPNPAAPPPEPTGPGDITTFTPEPFSLEPKEAPSLIPADEDPERTAAAALARSKADDQKPLTPAEIEARRQNNDTLRTSLEERNRLLKEREDELAKERADRVVIEREREDARRERQEAHDRLEEFQRSVGKVDPMLDARVVAINKQFDDAVGGLAQDISMDGGKGANLKQMIPGMLAKYREIGSPDSPQFEERRDAFNQEVRENFPEHEREVRNLVREGVKLQGELTTRISEIHGNAEKFKLDREREAFRTVAEQWEEKERRFFKPSKDVEENDPFNAEVICAKLLEFNDDTRAGKKKILDFCRSVALPQPPLDPADLAKMSKDDQVRYLQGRNQQREALREKVQSILPISIASMQLLPSIYKRMIEAEKALADQRSLEPPPPNGEQTDLEDGPKDIKQFTATNPLLDELSGKR